MDTRDEVDRHVAALGVLDELLPARPEPVGVTGRSAMQRVRDDLRMLVTDLAEIASRANAVGLDGYARNRLEELSAALNRCSQEIDVYIQSCQTLLSEQYEPTAALSDAERMSFFLRRAKLFREEPQAKARYRAVVTDRDELSARRQTSRDVTNALYEARIRASIFSTAGTLETGQLEASLLSASASLRRAGAVAEPGPLKEAIDVTLNESTLDHIRAVVTVGTSVFPLGSYVLELARLAYHVRDRWAEERVTLEEAVERVRALIEIRAACAVWQQMRRPLLDEWSERHATSEELLQSAEEGVSTLLKQWEATKERMLYLAAGV
ncbi:MAG: hypothetical protein ABR606_04175 [Vicinamibacterales bacterium]